MIAWNSAPYRYTGTRPNLSDKAPNVTTITAANPAAINKPTGPMELFPAKTPAGMLMKDTSSAE
ncbi:hypothetical protein D3C73_1043120 [compost metagenome]